FRSLFYTPQFVAIHGGHLAAEGLEIALTTATQGGGTVDALRSGSADLALGGLMRSFELVDRGGPRLVHFAAVNDRNGFFLLSREPRRRFAWADLVGRTVMSFGGAPTPWLCMQAVLRRHGLDPARVTFVRDLSTPDAVAAFCAGKADFLEHGPPVVDELIAGGAGHLVASMGEATGPVPFSSYMATPETLGRERDIVGRFVGGLYRAQRWMAAATATEIAAVVAPAFADIDAGARAPPPPAPVAVGGEGRAGGHVPFLVPHAVRAHRGSMHVAQERERERVPPMELRLGEGAVAADREHDGPAALHVCGDPAEVAQ